MYIDVEKMGKTKELLLKIAKGINPLTGEPFEKQSFLNDPKIVRGFYFMAEVLDNTAKGGYQNRYRGGYDKFIITPEQKSRVTFPAEKIGVNEFSRCVNSCIDLNQSRKLTGVELNKRLKKLGILNAENTPEGKTRTILNETSAKYGFETEKRSYNGVEYDKILINEAGKKYLLDNLEKIMAVELEKAS